MFTSFLKQNLILKFAFCEDLPTYAKFVWTSGHFPEKYGMNQEFIFAGSGETWEYSKHGQHWDWVQNKLIMNPTEEKCMLIVDIQEKFVIRPVVCDLTNYFMCYEEVFAPPPEPEPTTTTTSTTTEPSSLETTRVPKDSKSEENQFSGETTTEESTTETEGTSQNFRKH